MTAPTDSPDVALYGDRELCLTYDEVCALSARLYAEHKSTADAEVLLDKVEAEMTKRGLI
jgi:hypothetical protein